MKTSLWLVIVIVVGFLGFLLGYSVSSYTGIQTAQKGSVGEVGAGGYPSEESAGYGTESAGYGTESGGYGKD
jgi:hypothetical protein